MTVKLEWIVFQTSAPGLKALMGQLPQRKKMCDVCHLIVLLTQGQHSTGLFRNSSEDIKTMASAQWKQCAAPLCTEWACWRS